MKGGLLTLSLLLSIGAGAQDTLTTYYDKGWNKSDQEHAKYYQKAVQNNDLWFVNQYIAEDNQLELSGSYKVVNTIRHGHFITYHKNGSKEAEGDYIDNIQVGSWTRWYNDGIVSSKEVYLSEVTDIVKVIEQDSVIRTLYKARNKRDGYDGIRQGLCSWYHSNGKVSTKEVYKEGKIIDARFWDEQGNSQQIEVTDLYNNTVFPQFKGKDLNAFIARNLEYPKEAIKQGIQGRVVIQFAVGTDGTIVDYEIKKSLGSKEIDAEAIRVVRLLNHQFTPGMGHNRPARIYFALPISFKL